MKPALVILDRDGVINFDSPDYIKSADEWRPIPGSLEAIALMHSHDIKIYIATNQAGVARGKLSMTELEGIHRKLLTAVKQAGGEIAGIEFCPHHPDDRCDCRKPNPGMLRTIAISSGIGLSGQPFVGDSQSDIHAANAAGCKPVLVLTGNGVKTREQLPGLEFVYADLLTFAKALVQSE